MTLFVTKITKPGSNGVIEFICETLQEVAKKYFNEFYSDYNRKLFIDTICDIEQQKIFQLTSKNCYLDILIITNHRNNIISIGMIKSAMNVEYYDVQKKKKWWKELRIPGTKRWSRRFRYYRRPGTIQERRENQQDGILEEDEPRSRAARNNKNLPSNWDDLMRSNQDVRNWKNFRITQWK